MYGAVLQSAEQNILTKQYLEKGNINYWYIHYYDLLPELQGYLPQISSQGRSCLGYDSLNLGHVFLCVLLDVSL